MEVGVRGSGNPVSGGLGVGASSNSSGEVVVRTQRTLTVIIKFSRWNCFIISKPDQHHFNESINSFNFFFFYC